MLLCSVEFVLLQGNFKAQGTCTIFRTTPSLPHLIRSVLKFLGMWICEILLCALQSVLFKEELEFMFKSAYLYNVCLCHLL